MMEDGTMSGVVMERMMSKKAGGNAGRKKGPKKAQKTIHIDADLLARVEQLADEDRRSLSQMIEIILEDQLKRMDEGDE
jgi:hypothetical protein